MKNYVKWWWKSFKFRDFFNNLLAFVGGITTFLKITDFLYKDFILLYKFWIWFVTYLIAFVYAVVKSIPKKSIVYKMDKKDIKIEIKIGDMLKNQSSFIIPIDNNFQVGLKEDDNLQSSKSVLACVVRKYFHSERELLQNKIDASRKDKKPAMGDVVKVFYNGKKFYFLANSVKEKGKDKVLQEKNYLDESLNGLWQDLTKFCENETISIPLITGGYGGNKASKISIIKKIINSFILSVKSGNTTYCPHLIISVCENDFYENVQSDDFNKIEEYLQFICYNYEEIFDDTTEKKNKPNIRIL